MAKKTPIPIIICIFKKFKIQNNNIYLKTICLTKGIRINDFDINKIRIIINEKKYKPIFTLEKGIPFIRKYRFNKMILSIPIEDLNNIDIQNKIIVNYKDYNGRIIYNLFDLKKGKYRNSILYF